jgi:hypothetical protein
MKELEDYLISLPQGVIQDQDIKNIEKYLEKVWEQLEDSNATQMCGFKLRRGIENVKWNPPILSFIIERHGGTVMGSSRAERQSWSIDIIQKKAYSGTVGYRQIYKRQPNLNVELLVKEVFKLINEGTKDDRLKWNKDGSVRILIGKINELSKSSAVKQTMLGRRKRFMTSMDELMNSIGWVKLKSNIYAPPSS